MKNAITKKTDDDTKKVKVGLLSDIAIALDIGLVALVIMIVFFSVTN